ncbi:MAG: hypothetical protein WCF06_09435 [Nitrososphaeraceae archaeon]
MHFKDPIADIDIGVNGRDKELAKPVMQLFYNTAPQHRTKYNQPYRNSLM